MCELSSRIGNTSRRNITNDCSGFPVSECLQNIEPSESGSLIPVRSFQNSVERRKGFGISFNAVYGRYGPVRECLYSAILVLGSEPFCPFLIE